MSVILTTVTGDFPNAIGMDASVTFTPTADLTDVTDAEFVAEVPVRADLSSTGRFSQALISTGNAQLAPSGWQWQAVISIGQRSAMFAFYLPSSPSTVDISSLMPAGFQI